ncbi:MAG TPA: exodeoxyribonuclease III [Planctomycetota bacterium]|nr:exodeoxyribonuclease III [Planctomycetota bacterium]
MILASWNINSIRARIDLLCDYLAFRQPDILCLQELKCETAQVPVERIAQAGYRAVIHGQRTYNGVAILSRLDATDPVPGIKDRVVDDHARLVMATIAGIRIASVYAPNGQEPDSPAFRYKLLWFERLKRYLGRRHRASDALVLIGDFNVAPEPIDVHNPKRWEGHTHFTIPERAALADLRSFGLVDAMRLLFPDRTRMFTWWDYRLRAFEQDRGLRLDHILMTAPVARRLLDGDVDRDWRAREGASDHAPLWVRIADEDRPEPRRAKTSTEGRSATPRAAVTSAKPRVFRANRRAGRSRRGA